MAGERVLVVDPDPGQLAQIESHLQAKGYHVTLERNGTRALHLLREHTFDLLLSELDLPGASGLQLLEEAQSLGTHSCVILMAKTPPVEVVIATLQKGAYSLLRKPLNFMALEATLEKGLENRQAFLEILGLSEDLKRANLVLNEQKEELEREKRTLEEKIRELDFLKDLSSAIGTTLDPKEIALAVSSRLKTVIPYDLFLLSCTLEKGAVLFLDSGLPLPPALGSQIRAQALQDLATLTGYLCRAGEEIQVEALRGDPFQDNGAHSYGSERAMECKIVLSLAQKPVGVLNLINFEGKPYGNDQMALLHTVANQTGLALKNAEEHRKVQEMANRDSLTGLLNHRTFQEILKREFKRILRYKKPLAIGMIDIDHLKMVNDSYGHPTGDQVLREMSALLERCIRETDVLARYGGDEFALLLPETNLGEARILGERMRRTVENFPFRLEGGEIHITISLGISSYPTLDVSTGHELIAKADKALYKSKREGRNRVSTAGESTVVIKNFPMAASSDSKLQGDLWKSRNY
ncbi:MAG: diguanylate cyclase [Candidatus Tectomicrobia bacterium]|uniref:diguanylate cyclase n=1 Tax=Tectimicrobiota bacterium TaxID=2528274 RepID=A0A932GNJ5_UNCTE|nr:diguanylate cyclase [Candidatus Tectomicrobia bacterium]